MLYVMYRNYKMKLLDYGSIFFENIAFSLLG